MMPDYDIEDAFAAIEDELITSMIRNMRRHRVEEIAEDKQWAMWQAMQLESLERYKKRNRKKFGSWFSDINGRIGEVLREANKQGYMDQEIEILKAIQSGFLGYRRMPDTMQAEFFKLNERKLETLIHAAEHDMEKAETAILRRADDQYRKAIFNAQVYANTGAGTYEKAVDMATRDMLSAGLKCVVYANGAMHTLQDYADMALHTASKRAYLQGEGLKRQEWGITTVIVNKRGNPCPKCLPFCGKILIDDVWSGGSKDGISPVTGLKYPLISSAIAAGLYHPRCKDSHTTYFEGISSPLDSKYTRKELDQIAEDYRNEQKIQHAKQQVDKYGSLAKHSLDAENQKEYGRKARIWKNKIEEWKDDIITNVKLAGFKNSLDEIKNADVKILLMQSLDRTSFRTSKGNVAYFDGKVIFLTRKSKADTIAHEIFHEIDKTYGLTENGLLSQSVRNDYSSLKNMAEKYGKSIPEMLYLKYPKAFYKNDKGELRVYEKYAGISDVLDGMSRREIKLGYGHSRKGYWDRPLQLEKETFAEYGRMMYMQDEDVMRMAKEIFPSVDREIRDVLKRVIK